jgi:hypothetical protein
MTPNYERAERLIKANDAEFNDGEQLSNFIDAYLSESHAITDLEDYISEHADSLVPIYYNDIMTQWRDNNDCQGMADEQGILEAQKDVYKIMQADLFCWYDQRLREDYNKLLELLEEAEEEEPSEPTTAEIKA